MKAERWKLAWRALKGEWDGLSPARLEQIAWEARKERGAIHPARRRRASAGLLDAIEIEVVKKRAREVGEALKDKQAYQSELMLNKALDLCEALARMPEQARKEREEGKSWGWMDIDRALGVSEIKKLWEGEDETLARQWSSVALKWIQARGLGLRALDVSIAWSAVESSSWPISCQRHWAGPLIQLPKGEWESMDWLELAARAAFSQTNRSSGEHQQQIKEASWRMALEMEWPRERLSPSLVRWIGAHWGRPVLSAKEPIEEAMIEPELGWAGVAALRVKDRLGADWAGELLAASEKRSLEREKPASTEQASPKKSARL